MNQNNNENGIEEWKRRAKDDEISALVLLKEGAPSTICFLSHQIAEKYLKIFLLSNRIKFPKIHQLDLLLKLCADIDNTFKNFRDDAILLNDYYIDTRYPGEYPEFTRSESENAFKAAIRIKDFVLTKIV